jgi:hypothetical protein
VAAATRCQEADGSSRLLQACRHNQQLGTALGRLLGGRNQLRYGTARMALWQAGSPHAWWCGGSIGIRVGRSEGVVRAPRGRPRRRRAVAAGAPRAARADCLLIPSYYDTAKL